MIICTAEYGSWLSLRCGGPRISAGYLKKKIEPKEIPTVCFPAYLLYLPGNLKSWSQPDSCTTQYLLNSPRRNYICSVFILIKIQSEKGVNREERLVSLAKH